MGASQGARRAPSQRYAPLAYFGAALIIAALVLPSALRPPQDQQSTTASFSPDAPPDDAPPEALLQAIRRASSSTAGGSQQNAEEAIEQAPPPPPPPPPPPKKAARNACYGDPPRQTESLYSALCVPAFTGGDNGGHTAPGVYKDEIRLGVVVPPSSDAVEGRLDRDFQPTDGDDEHLSKVWQTYLNERFEFYGRYLQFYVVKQPTSGDDLQRSSVDDAKTNYDLFAMIGNGAAGVNEAIHDQIIDFGSVNNPLDFYNAAFPYAYSFYEDTDQAIGTEVELACKQFAHQPPGALNERMDPTFDYGSERKWGTIFYQDPTRTGASALAKKLFKEKCNQDLTDQEEYNLTDNAQALAGITQKMRAKGVTTIFLGVDGLSPTYFTAEASRLGYFPEWVHGGQGGIDSDLSGRGMDKSQVTHMVGLSPSEIPRVNSDKDWYRAYKEVDPEGDPSIGYFRSFQQLAGGIQMAGPNLTAMSFWAGLSKQPFRTPDPIWSIGGGYRETIPSLPGKDLTYMDFEALVWFDPVGKDPNSTSPGAWCYVNGGQRYQLGGIPTDPIPWFKKDQCITTPPAGVNG